MKEFVTAAQELATAAKDVLAVHSGENRNKLRSALNQFHKVSAQGTPQAEQPKPKQKPKEVEPIKQEAKPEENTEEQPAELQGIDTAEKADTLIQE